MLECGYETIVFVIKLIGGGSQHMYTTAHVFLDRLALHFTIAKLIYRYLLAKSSLASSRLLHVNLET